MSRIEATYRLAKQLMDNGMTAHDALEEAKRKVAAHPTAEFFGLMRIMRERIHRVRITNDKINGAEVEI